MGSSWPTSRPQQGACRRLLDARDAPRVSEVRLITDFPITTVVYEYSRTEAEPADDVYVRIFRGEGGGDRMFAMTAEAEAVMFSLDPEAVIDWLDVNGILQKRPEESVEQWLLERLRQYPYFSEVDPTHDGPAARYSLTLLHTMSHLVINGVDTLSGYSKSSLIECLLFHTLSFVVYKRTDTDYSLRAMHMLVEKRFRELGDYIQNEGESSDGLAAASRRDRLTRRNTTPLGLPPRQLTSPRWGVALANTHRRRPRAARGDGLRFPPLRTSDSRIG